jgi:hypothetical protein
MTILTSLLIATQGLLPSLTPLSIGTQGLLQTGEAPPPPPPPPIVGRDLPGGFVSRPVQKVKVRGNQLRISAGDVAVKISSRVALQGNRAATELSAPAARISAYLEATGNVQDISAGRAKQRISTAFEIVGCGSDDEAEIRLLAQVALEEFYLDRIVKQYDD